VSAPEVHDPLLGTIGIDVVLLEAPEQASPDPLLRADLKCVGIDTDPEIDLTRAQQIADLEEIRIRLRPVVVVRQELFPQHAVLVRSNIAGDVDFFSRSICKNEEPAPDEIVGPRPVLQEVLDSDEEPHRPGPGFGWRLAVYCNELTVRVVLGELGVLEII